MPDFDSPFHRLSVTDNDGVRLLKFERNQQSSMLIDDPFETTIEYVGYLHITLAVKPDAERTLVIGLGGGSVVKRMWRDYPAMSLDVAEIDGEVVEVASALFELPDDDRIDVHIADGREFLTRRLDTYDIIIVDAFDDDRVPRPLLTEEFMRLAKDHLAARRRDRVEPLRRRVRAALAHVPQLPPHGRQRVAQPLGLPSRHRRERRRRHA